ncbi:MAG: hypothetical protein ACLSU5_10160, partial [Sutterella wadsworthensis]
EAAVRHLVERLKLPPKEASERGTAAKNGAGSQPHAGFPVEVRRHLLFVHHFSLLISMKAETLENETKKTPPAGYSIPMLMRDYYGLALPVSPIVCAVSGLRAIPSLKRIMP